MATLLSRPFRALPPGPRAGRALHVLGQSASWVAIGVLAIVVAGLIVILLAPRLFHWEFVIVAGGSMEPAIPSGSVAIMERIAGDDVAIGDVIKFRDPTDGHLVTHRVIGTSEAGLFVTRGDANAAIDLEPVPPENIEARYLFNVPHAGSLLRVVGTPGGYIAVVLVPGALIILFEVIAIIRAQAPRKRAAPSQFAQPMLAARMRPVHHVASTSAALDPPPVPPAPGPPPLPPGADGA